MSSALTDIGAAFEGAPGLEFRLATDELERGQSGLCFQRIPPGSWRGCEAGADGVELLVFGAPSLGDARRDDVEGARDWWTD